MSRFKGLEKFSIVEKGLFSEVIEPYRQSEKIEAIYFEFPLIGFVNILCFNISGVGVEIEVELLNVYSEIRIDSSDLIAGKTWLCKTQGVFEKIPDVIKSHDCGWRIDTRESVIQEVVKYFNINKSRVISKKLYNTVLKLSCDC